MNQVSLLALFFWGLTALSLFFCTKNQPFTKFPDTASLLFIITELCAIVAFFCSSVLIKSSKKYTPDGTHPFKLSHVGVVFLESAGYVVVIMLVFMISYASFGPMRSLLKPFSFSHTFYLGVLLPIYLAHRYYGNIYAGLIPSAIFIWLALT